jgi:valyl-tRNA synthetase
MTEDLKYFYPTDVLVTGYDIIFFWVIRMIFSGFEQMGERPFKAVLFHGLVRDSQGRKMSKSLGNGIDPLQVIADYGADALRMTLITGNAPGNDMRFYDERVIANRNFANKVWNASRFIMMNLPEEGTEDDALLRAMIDKDLVPDAIAPEDKWILSRLNDTVQAVTENMNKYELGIAVQKVYDFMWDEFCDWYIEMVKPRLYKADDRASRLAALWTLLKVLISGLKLLHPYMPFITEEIFTTVQSKEESIMISSWPVARDDFSFPHEEEAIENIKDAVRAVRAVRNERKVAPSRKAKIFVVSDKEEVLAMFRENQLFFETLASASDTVLCKDKAEVPEGALSVILPYAALYLPLADLMDVSAEIERLMKEEKRLMGELKRSAGMLSNEKFLAKAPASKIEAEREKQKAYEEQMKGVREELENLKKL